MTIHDEKVFNVGDHVQSVFDVGTVYRVVAIQPHHLGNRTQGISVETVRKGPQPDAGSMSESDWLAVYHFNPVRRPD